MCRVGYQQDHALAAVAGGVGAHTRPSAAAVLRTQADFGQRVPVAGGLAFLLTFFVGIGFKSTMRMINHFMCMDLLSIVEIVVIKTTIFRAPVSSR